MLQIAYDIYTVSPSVPGGWGRKERAVKGGWGVIINEGEKRGGKEGGTEE